MNKLQQYSSLMAREAFTQYMRGKHFGTIEGNEITKQIAITMNVNHDELVERANTKLQDYIREVK